MDEWMVATSAIAYITKLNKRKKERKKKNPALFP
jgi:hypothetical protein